MAHLLADEGVMRHVGDEPIELLARRQLAPDEQVRDLEERRLLGQLLDRIAAVAQDPRFAVEEGDGARAGAGVAVAGVERDQPGIAAEPADVDRVVALGAMNDRQLHLLLTDAEGRRSGARRRVGCHASSSSTAARSSSSSWVVASIFELAKSSCSMPWTISTPPAAVARNG